MSLDGGRLRPCGVVQAFHTSEELSRQTARRMELKYSTGAAGGRLDKEGKEAGLRVECIKYVSLNIIVII